MRQENPSNTNCNASMNSILPRVMRKAVSLPFENRKPMLEAFVVVCLPLAFLVLLHYQIASPFMAKVEDGYENSALNRKDLISLMVIELPFAVTLCLLLLFSAAIAILASVSAHQGVTLRVKDTLLSLKWKRILVFGLYIFFVMIVFAGLTIGLCFTPLTPPLVGIVAALAFPYIASLTTLLLVVSTVEYECPGITAFNRATKIITQDKFNSYFLMLALLLLSTPFDVMFYVTTTDDDDVNGWVTRFGFLLVSTVLFCLTNFFTSIVYTLFYLDYKERNGEKMEMQSQYQLVPTATNTDV